VTIEDLDAVDDHISSPEGGEHRARATKIRRGATIVTWLAIAYVWVGTPSISNNWWWLTAVARLADGATDEATTAQATALHRGGAARN
jgi:hypothetical protein